MVKRNGKVPTDETSQQPLADQLRADQLRRGSVAKQQLDAIMEHNKVDLVPWLHIENGQVTSGIRIVPRQPQ